MTPTANEMLAYLATAPEGMTTSHLADHCPSALDRTAVSRAAYQLRTAGLIHEVGRVPSHEGRGVRPVAVYAITEAGRDYLSAETPADDLPGALDEAPDEEREALRAEWRNADLDQAPTLGMDTTTAEELQSRIGAASAVADPVLQEVANLSKTIGRIHSLIAAQHVTRLRALADAMARLVGYEDQTVATYLWLHELADLLGGEPGRVDAKEQGMSGK